MNSSTWMFLAYGEDATYLGNEGYGDSPEQYSFGSTVINYSRVRAGDLAVVAMRGGRARRPVVAGLARIARIEARASTKIA